MHSMKVVFRYIHSNNVTVKRPLARRVDRDIRWNVCNETQVQDPTPGGGGGGVLGYILGGYVPPGSPNLDPVLERICTQNDTPF